jgi:hypothetical protein
MFIMPRPVCNYVYRIVLQFYGYFFLRIFTLMWSVAFSLSRFYFELCNPITCRSA